jgi:hypothetical protein
MEPGFMVDETRFDHDVQKWVAGMAVRGWLSRLKGPLVAYDVVTFRCAKCGMLESYVPAVRTKARARRSAN